MNSREGDAQSHNTSDSVSRAHSYGKLVAFFAARAMWWLPGQLQFPADELSVARNGFIQ